MRIGTITALYRFPVKAMAAEALTEAHLDWFGVEGDRRYAFVRGDDTSDFPWLTIRQVPELTRFVPSLTDGREPVVRTPEGRELRLRSPELAEDLAARYGGPVHLHRDHRGTQDAFPVSVISVQAVRALGDLVGRPLEPARFRMSVVVDLPGRGAFPEDELVGSSLALGDARVHVAMRDKRCMVINTDPQTAERDPSVLRAVARHRDSCLGVYGTCERPAVIRVGDPVIVASG
jgi:hypothetical protein